MTAAHASRLAVALLVLAPVASSADLTRSGGLLGTQVTYDLEGAPFTLFVLAPSVTTGPLPLAIFDPADPRALDVGFELIDFWTLGSFDVAGQAQVVLPLPASPTLHGVALHAQFVEMPVFPTLFGEISNRVTVTLGQSQGSANVFGANYAPIFGHEATLLNDGRVLLSGGYNDTISTGVGNTLGVYDPQTETTTQEPGLMTHNRVLHQTVVMPDGRVLILGGADESATPRPSGDLYDPATGLTTPIADMLFPRAGHTATLLPDGRVFAAGGIVNINSSMPLDNLNLITDTTEIYDPVTDSWSLGPPLPRPRLGHFATLLDAFGWVLIAGGLEVDELFGMPVPVVSVECERYVPDPSGATPGFLFATENMTFGRALPGGIALDDGRVLVLGGGQTSIVVATGVVNVVPLDTTEIYDPIQDSWSQGGDLNVARAWPDVVRLAGGEIAVVGGNHQGDFLEILLANTNAGIRDIETTDQSAASFAVTGQMLLKRFIGGANVAIEGGTRLLTSGEGDNGMSAHDTTVEMYYQ